MENVCCTSSVRSLWLRSEDLVKWWPRSLALQHGSLLSAFTLIMCQFSEETSREAASSLERWFSEKLAQGLLFSHFLAGLVKHGSNHT